MHRLLIALFLICLTALPAIAEQTVIGTGNPGQDIANVQAAVDAGGTVLLKGRFNFGPEGRIKITKDIRIKGEFDSVDEPKTKISGGWWTFYSPLPVKGHSRPATADHSHPLHSF